MVHFFVGSFSGVTEEALLSSLERMDKLSSIEVDSFSIPNMPSPPNAFRGIRQKSYSLQRWLSICSDMTTKCVNVYCIT